MMCLLGILRPPHPGKFLAALTTKSQPTLPVDGNTNTLTSNRGEAASGLVLQKHPVRFLHLVQRVGESNHFLGRNLADHLVS